MKNSCSQGVNRSLTSCVQAATNMRGGEQVVAVATGEAVNVSTQRCAVSVEVGHALLWMKWVLYPT
jgi:hypothetical protein